MCRHRTTTITATATTTTTTTEMTTPTTTAATGTPAATAGKATTASTPGAHHTSRAAGATSGSTPPPPPGGCADQAAAWEGLCLDQAASALDHGCTADPQLFWSIPARSCTTAGACWKAACDARPRCAALLECGAGAAAPTGPPLAWVLLAALGAGLLCAAGAGARHCTTSRAGTGDAMELSKVHHDYSDVARELVLRRDQVELGRRLGSGHFGAVYLATLHRSAGGTTAAAVKEPKAGEVGEFEKEVEVVCKVHRLGSHANIVGALGYVPEGRNGGRPLLVLEYCPLGDLKAFLCEKGAGGIPGADLLLLCRDVASAMAFLEAALIAHRDLAARNVLLTAAGRCQITDFGLSRNTAGADYYRRQTASAPIPIRWVAVETLTHDISTLASDRWSFGVVMWEVFSFGARPYAGMPNKDIFAHVAAGHRLKQPPRCPAEVHALMEAC